MSAECSECGFDLVYPGDSWPIGVCQNCEQQEEIAALQDENERLREALEGLLHAEWMVSVDWCDPSKRDAVIQKADQALAKSVERSPGADPVLTETPGKDANPHGH